MQSAGAWVGDGGASGDEKPGPLLRGLQPTWRDCLYSSEEEENK